MIGTNIHLFHQDYLPPGLKYDPRTGIVITEPHVNIHNGTYLCIFTDNSGKKVSKLYIILDVERKMEGIIQLEVHFTILHTDDVTDD